MKSISLMFLIQNRNPARASFTIIELLIVIGILVVLSIALVLALNPAELLKQARDGARLADIAELKRAITTVGLEATNIGSANTVYISVPDPAGSAGVRTKSAFGANVCGGISGLPQLPSAFQYECVAEADLRKTDSAGWIPINFNSFSGGSPFPALPIDPVNDALFGRYYAYVVNPAGVAMYAIAAAPESSKYREEFAMTDGGTDPVVYETGSDLALWANASGLLAYWKFDEGGASNISRAYLKGSTAALFFGTLGSNTSYAAMWTSGIPGKINGSLGFDGTDDFAAAGMAANSVTAQATIHGWFDWTSGVTSLFADNVSIPGWNLGYSSFGSLRFRAGGTEFNTGQPVAPLQGAWHHYAFTKNGADVKYFIDGVEVFSGTGAGATGNSGLTWRFMRHGSNSSLIRGKADDVRMYNRPLTALEVQAYYNATQ